jgi:sugar lactone lactonase YvrE
MAITPDGTTLVVAQTRGARLTAYTISTDGSLDGERVFADLGAAWDYPDGICMDAEGAVWMADPIHQCCVRIVDGGQPTHVVETKPYACIACALGGPDRRTLFLMLSPPHGHPDSPRMVLGEPATSLRPSRIEAIEVDVPGAGSP